MAPNPLSKYFRQPGIHVTLPSRGFYFKNNEARTAMNGEIAVLPMTAADEIIANNPDSLLNGAALEKIITSCCPGIKFPRQLPIIDVDVIMLAAKLVSYGDSLELSAECPKCKTINTFDVSIKNLLGKIKELPDEISVRLNDEVLVFIKPYSLEISTRINMSQFEETKLIQHLLSTEVEEKAKVNTLAASFDRITTLNLDSLSDCVVKVVTPEGEVSDAKQIKEFVNNVPREFVKKIQAKLKELNEYGLPKTVEVICKEEKCKHEWETAVVYDPSSFFVSDS
jgi:hypothetical protein